MKPLRRTRLLLMLAMLACTPAQADFSGRVLAVPDGDTLDIQHEGRATRVRIAGIDAPELLQRHGARAQSYLATLALNKQAMVEERGMDRNGYTVARVQVYGTDVGLRLLNSGMAWHLKGQGRMQNQTPEESSIYAVAEARAKKHRAGLWQDLNPLPPWEWRLLQQRIEPGR